MSFVQLIDVNFCLKTVLQDCVQSEGKLYLIFEFVDRDLKKYMEATQGMLDPMLVKVRRRETWKMRTIYVDRQAGTNTKLSLVSCGGESEEGS